MKSSGKPDLATTEASVSLVENTFSRLEKPFDSMQIKSLWA